MPIRNKSKNAAAARHAASVAREPMPPFVPISAPSPKRLIDKAAVLERVPLSYPTIWKLMREGSFPRSIACGAKVAWFEDEIEKFLANLPRRQFKGE